MHLIYKSNVINTKGAFQTTSQNKSSFNRKRLLIMSLITIIATFCFMFGAIINVFAAEGTGEVQFPQEDRIIIHVQSGDTLWSIAKLHRSETIDIRDFIYKIKDENGLKSSNLSIGQTIMIPKIAK
ncbi:LysM peptidoglycan-binding domain-containing protein [Chengkuizengella axinellae]|uniref:LysM peptidoglycan-binding domain-containing protein n=1 Tax=Chengkuizengella axinellae TaxID=3064388 RepID=A0ABT9IXE9_9BACL|nr:LysM peptidoglycan-binding domain-containing protein [Chengkuizengella sp. 2205SS18-9]MDP5274027.1 LysM peptidoglycan-binding domain-containing protein [Chengkuizengella sp. 2205SS18-9]